MTQLLMMQNDTRQAGNFIILILIWIISPWILGLRIMKMFKAKLVEISTRQGFEFKFIKNGALRVQACCVAKRCKWLILCSWCSGKQIFIVKHYESSHSCLLGTTKNRRVIAPEIAKRFRETLTAMPFIKPRHFRAMVRKEMGAFITKKVCRNARRLLIKKM